MKVLIVNSVCGTGSTGRICTSLAEELIRSGHECMIAYGRGKVSETTEYKTYRICNKLELISNGVKARCRDNEGFNAINETQRLINLIKVYDPDLIHLNNLHGYYVNVELLFQYLKETSIRVIWTLHDCWAFTGHCAHYEIENCYKWKTRCRECPRYKKYPAAYTSHADVNYTKKKQAFSGVQDLTIVTPSKWLASQVKESILGEYPICVINNGVDMSVFTKSDSDFKRQHHLEGKKLILGVSSAWPESKGFHDFIKLSGVLDDDCRIVMVGVNKKQLRQLPSNIIGIQKTDNARDLAAIYTAADVFFNPTYSDTYPTVNLEAQACGTPVVTYRTGGSTESVPEDNVIRVGDFTGVIPYLHRIPCISKNICSKEKMLQDYMHLYELNENDESHLCNESPQPVSD